jgi:hypothetical protein
LVLEFFSLHSSEESDARVSGIHSSPSDLRRLFREVDFVGLLVLCNQAKGRQEV